LAGSASISDRTDQVALIAGFVVFDDHRGDVVKGDCSSPLFAMARLVHDDSD
jgi:hypothetical protein